MYEEILITQLNDFIFCPASIYFHILYGDTDRMMYQSEKQINGTAAHSTIDQNTYTDRKDVLSGTDVYCEEYGLVGKIDIFNITTGALMERKRQIKQIYDGYMFQVYAQCFALREMGYQVSKITLHSMVDNKNYKIPLPEEDDEMLRKFKDTVRAMHEFQLEDFVQDNVLKCRNCIYEPACDRGLTQC